MPLLELEQISRRYGKLLALDQISLRLEAGTIGLVGNNGAGKSTLLKILLGLLRPDSGRGNILGYDVFTAASRLRGRVGYMSEAAAVVPLLRGVEFVALSGELYGMPRRDAQRRAHEVLDYVGLGELRYRRLDEYSTGNAQRLKLAAALVHDPELLLLDEPTNGLDPSGRQAMLQLLRDLIADTGKSVILCTHLLADVERLCDQIVVLHHGRVASCGALRVLREQLGRQYELRWQGRGTELLTALRAAGVEVQSPVERGRALLTLPADWSPARCYQLALRTETVVTQLSAQSEDLEQLFFRLTRPTASSLGEVR